MSEQVWYVYQNGQQLGPFSETQVKQMISIKMIPQDAYIFKVGWKDWRPLEESLEELGIASAPKTPQMTQERREAAPRASINARVIVHNNGQLVIGSGVNISASGIFVETADRLFTIGENLKLSIRSDSLAKPFNATATVIRYNADPRYSVGYGLHFIDLDPKVAGEIQNAVDRLNQMKAKVKTKEAK